MLTIILLVAILVFVGGVLYTLRNGVNQIIIGLESIDKRLKELESKEDKL